MSKDDARALAALRADTLKRFPLIARELMRDGFTLDYIAVFMVADRPRAPREDMRHPDAPKPAKRERWRPREDDNKPMAPGTWRTPKKWEAGYGS